MKHSTIIISLFVGASLLAGCSKATSTAAPSTSSTSTSSQGTTMDKTHMPSPTVLPADQLNNQQATITMASGDQIVIELFADAPLTTSNFIELAKAKFYDGLTFHRVEPGFVVQGGDPLGNGTGGPGYKFKDETVTRDYTQGIVAMANSGPNTNGSQFFIMLADTALPKSYTIFGQVTSGFEHVQTIKVGDIMKSVTIEATK